MLIMGGNQEIIKNDLENAISTYARDDSEGSREDSLATVVDYNTVQSDMADKLRATSDAIAAVNNLTSVKSEIAECLALYATRYNELHLASVWSDYLNVRIKIVNRIHSLENNGKKTAASSAYYETTRGIREEIYKMICDKINEGQELNMTFDNRMPSNPESIHNYCIHLNNAAVYFYKKIYGTKMVPDEDGSYKYRDTSIAKYIKPQNTLRFLHKNCFQIPYEFNVKHAFSAVFRRGGKHTRRGNAKRRPQLKRTKRSTRSKRRSHKKRRT